MGDYDKIIKENLEAIFLPLLEKLTGIQVIQSEEVKDKLQRTLEREPDFLKLITDGSGNKFILQLEFQTQNDAKMVYRMAEYKALLLRKYELPVKQFVIFLGTANPSMKTQLNPEEQILGFELKNIKDLPVDHTLSSEVPEEIILSILANYPESNIPRVINSIVNKLQKISSDEIQLRRAIQQLFILSRLRNLEEEVEKKVNSMPITYDIKTDQLYNKGIKQGIERGIERGIEQNKTRMIKKALKQGFLNLEQIAEMAEVDVSFVVSIREGEHKD